MRPTRPNPRRSALAARLSTGAAACLAAGLVSGLAFALPAAQAGAKPAPQAETTVGLSGHIAELVLPGGELEVAARASSEALVLRIARVSPHGSDFRYDLEFVGLEPGDYDLGTALRRKDGTPLPAAGEPGALPPIPVRVTSVLEPGIVKPHAPLARTLPSFGGYRTALIAGGVAWLAGLALILFGWRKRRRAEIAAARPPTLAERLRPLVERALAGELSREERSQLEGSLIAFWRRKLGLEEERPAALVARLRAHPEAGPLLSSLEAWLHMPTPPRDVDVGALLAPYRDLPPDALEGAGSGARAGASTGSSAPRAR